MICITLLDAMPVEGRRFSSEAVDGVPNGIGYDQGFALRAEAWSWIRSQKVPTIYRLETFVKPWQKNEGR